MNSCLVLSDATVHNLLINLTRDEIHTFLGKIEECLKDFSVGDERSHQPDPVVINRDGRKNLFRLFNSSTGVGVKIIVDPSQALASELQRDDDLEATRAEKNKLMGLHGILALCDQNGFPTGFINAEEITGFRTSLSAMILFVHRARTAKIVVFGAGKQALWHIRLALALRGEDIQRISVVNRSIERTKDLLCQVQKENGEKWKAQHVSFESVATGDAERLKSVVNEADVVFCTTPSQEVLFPADYVLGKEEGCYVSAIGSWSADMIELDPELLRVAALRDSDKGLVVVDNGEDCRKNTGEVAQSGLGEDQIAEVGEVLDLIARPTSKLRGETVKCLERGLVVYKSVGVSLTDLTAGQALLTLALKNKEGLPVPKF